MTQQSTDVTLEPTQQSCVNAFEAFCALSNKRKVTVYDLQDWFAKYQFVITGALKKLGYPDTRAALSKPVGEVMSARQELSARSLAGKLVGMVETFDSHRPYSELYDKIAGLLAERDAQLAQPPEGYVLVPIKSTDAMTSAYIRACYDETEKDGSLSAYQCHQLAYAAMINAAPKDTGADMASATAGKQGEIMKQIKTVEYHQV